MTERRQMSELQRIFENKRNILLYLGLIIVVSLAVRLYYIPINNPISLDGINYFVYAIATWQQGHFPDGIVSTNNGWPVFLSFFFFFLHSPDIIDYMNLQRIVSLTISVLTIIPIFLLCSRFVSRHYALFGTTIFAFDPRLIQNSLLGITEPLFILFIVLTLYFSFVKNNRLSLLSFVTAAFCSIVRYEGLLLIIPVSIMFFLNYKIHRGSLLWYLACICIFLLIIIPIAYFRIEAGGHDGLITNLLGGIKFVSVHVVEGIPEEDDPLGPEGGNQMFYFTSNLIVNFSKYLAWVSVPVYWFFVPLGLFIMVKNKDRKLIPILIFGATLLISATYAYGRNIPETRYLLPIFPLFSILSCYSYEIKKFGLKDTRITFFIITIIVLLASLMMIDYLKIDHVFDKEIHDVTKYIVDNAGGVNDYLGNRHVRVIVIESNWPELPELDKKGQVTFDIRKIPTSGFVSLEEYIKHSREKGLTHLLIMEKNKSEFLDDVFAHEEKYTYLHKEFDSSDHGFKNKIRIYKINYDLFSLTTHDE